MRRLISRVSMSFPFVLLFIVFSLSVFLVIDYALYPEYSLDQKCGKSRTTISLPYSDKVPVAIGNGFTPLKLSKGEYILTFDDGPQPIRTRMVADILLDKCVDAIFFNIGAENIAFPWLTRKLSVLGFSLGSHSFTHKDMTKMSSKQAAWEISSGFSALRWAAGPSFNTKTLLFRFPKWESSNSLLNQVYKNQAISVFSDISPADWKNDSPSLSYSRFVSAYNKTDRGIIVLHDIESNTPELLKMIIDRVRSDGGKFVGLDRK